MDKIYIIDETKSTQIIVDGQSVTYYLTPGIPERNTASDEPNYTDAQYHTAYANGLIIAAEIIKAHNEGYRYVRLKTGEYSLCASKGTSASSSLRPAIFLEGLHGIDVDFGDSTLRIINDSDFPNPHYYGSSYEDRTLMVSLYNCTEVHLHNAKMIGDVADRSWTNANERKFQGSNCITTEDRCANIEISKIEFSLWMNNAISNGNVFHNGFVRRNVTGWERGKTIDPETGEVVTQEETARPHYVSEMIEFDTPYHDVWEGDFGMTMRGYNSQRSIKGYENFLCFRAMATSQNWIYMPFMDYPGFTIYYYRRNENDELVYSNATNVSMSMLSNNFGYINIGGYDAMRVLITNEETDLSEVEDLTKYFMMLVQAVPNFGMKIHDCLIKDTHKGGMGNLPAFTVVEDNTFINCSKDCGLGVPTYNYDNTRYCIDLEDIFYTNTVIRNNRFDSSATAMFLGCDNIEVYGNLIIACESGISIRFGSNFNIHDNKITGTGYVFGIFSNSGTYRGGSKHITNISVHGNYFEGGSFSANASNQERRYTNYRDNLFIVNNIFLTGGTSDNIFTNCKFILKPGTITLQLRNSTFKDCILESSASRDAYITNIKCNNFYIKNITFWMQQDVSTKVEGIHFGTGSALNCNYDTSLGDTLMIKDCIFEGTQKLIVQSSSRLKVYVVDSVFKGVPACTSDVSTANYPAVFTAYNTKFRCSYENIFGKKATPNRPITYNLANCIFDYPI